MPRPGHITHLAGLAVAQLANTRAGVSLAQHVGMAADVAGVAQIGSVLGAEDQSRALADLARWAHAAWQKLDAYTSGGELQRRSCLRRPASAARRWSEHRSKMETGRYN
eukprot:GHRQ01033404.1.p1 GENE.GHRQ01033404.1~~GHRQ01033404.1.p1  ORF type:complete len:109 (+),score=5.90 GHRQ01033404.1:87-413(+)